VDLSALWAGPLVASLLGRGGARVVKVESADRPDGARRGDAAHYRSLNGGKASVVLDLSSTAGRRRLAGLVDRADVVVTASRPRALDQLGLDPGSARSDGAPRVWLSVSGYGTGPGSADRVAFGDDAAAAGGLVVWDGAGPCFCADAVADPATGLAATAAVLAELERGGDAWLEASMADVAAGLTAGGGDGDGAGPVRVAGPGWEPGPVRAPGADTASVLADLGVP
jgi:crotonobetainyl-CoA:carnitine CoA-transferase CaiB-like acyl-CoA transferase